MLSFVSNYERLRVMMLEKQFEVEVELIEPLLGTVPKNKDVYAKFIASKAADLELAAEEIATVKELENRGWTGFHEDEDGPFLYNYSVKGFLCEAARTLKQFGLLKQLQDKFTRYVFVFPRRIRLPKPDGEFAVLERPLRAQTAQGPRVTVTRSDVVPEGTKIKFTMDVLEGSGITQGCIEKVLSYGHYKGLGQWRNGGFGSFELVKLEEV